MIQSRIVFISIIFIFMGFFTDTHETQAQEKQSGHWSYYCDDLEQRRHCEIAQKIQIEEKNLSFLIVFKKSKEKNSEIKENLYIITPLGVNLKKSLKINFNKKTKYTQSFNKCEDYGCLVIFDKRLGMEYSLTNYNNMEISFYIDSVKEPVALKLPISGFAEALQKINEELNKY